MRMLRTIMRFAIAAGLLLIIWFLACLLFAPRSYVLPPPADVAARVWTDVRIYATHLLATVLATTLGLCLGFLTGVSLAIATVLIRPSAPLLETGAVVLRTLPIVSIAPIITLWFGTGLLARGVVAGLVCFFPIFAGFRQGMLRIDPSTLLLMRLYGATQMQSFLRFRLPTAVPLLVLATPLSATLAVLGALVAEFCGSDVGLGMLILRGLYRLDTEMLYAAMVLASGLGVSFYVAAEALELPFRKYMISVTDRPDGLEA